MTSILGRLFGYRPVEDDTYARAIAVSSDLLARMRAASRSSDPARAVMADLWYQRHNVPFLTTVHEAVQEAKSPLEQKPEDR